LKKSRQSNIELLRIVLILMVIILHYFNGGMGGALKHVINGTPNYYLVHWLESVSIIAVNTFVIITGYFSYKKNNIRIAKVLNLVAIMLFWGLLLSLLTVFLLHPQNITREVLTNILKTATNQWFVVIYCILYLLIPYLNKMISGINQDSYKWLLAIGLFFFYFWPSFYSKVTVHDNGYGIINFVYLYLVGAYISKYHKENKQVVKPLIIYVVCTLVVTVFSLKFGRAWDYCFIFNLFGSIAIFQAFRSINIKQNKFINYLATYTFAIYLIDVNGFFNKLLYRTLFHSDRYWNSNVMILNLIISVIGIYVICIILELLRRLVFGRLFAWFMDKVELEIKA